MSFINDPPMGSILRCITIPERGGDTMWADMAAAYAGLSDAMRHLIDGLEVAAVQKRQEFRFHWKPNSMVLWDNRGTQHYAANDYYPNRRTMQRVTIKRERAFS